MAAIELSKLEIIADAGAGDAQSYWDNLDDAILPKDPRSQPYADAALQKFIECLENRSAVDKKAIQGAARSAEQLNVSEFHGINEIIQNADDTGATKVQARLRTISGKQYLYVTHDGRPIELSEVLPIVIPYLTTKENDPLLKGKFGIGLKTCTRFSDRMDVHCTPYHFRAVGHTLERLKPERSISQFYDKESSNTLFVFRLRKEFDVESFENWLKKWEASSLLFLDSIREFVVHLGPRKLFRYELKASLQFEDRPVKIRGHTRSHSLVRFSSLDGKEKWYRYSVRFKVPKNLKRRYKQTGDDTIVSVAIPTDDSKGRVFVGLPTEIRLSTPTLIDAQFDPDPSRERLIHSSWNDWLMKRVQEVQIEAAVDLFARGEPACWNAVPLEYEDYEIDESIMEDFEDSGETIRTAIAKRAQIKIGRNVHPLSQISYLDMSLEEILDANDIQSIAGDYQLLPKSRRDPFGRWRQVLANSGLGHRISVSRVIELFDIEDACKSKSATWFVELAFRAIEENMGRALFSRKCILLADGRRVVPQKRENATDVLVIRQSDFQFPELQGAPKQIHSIYRRKSGPASAVREYFETHGNFFEFLDPFNFLLTLANAGIDDPIDIDDKDLIAIRDMLSKIGGQQRFELCAKLGRALNVEAFSWVRNKRKLKKALINECYIPSSIEKDKYGWSIAAGRTPGLTWISSRYATVFAGPARKPSNGSSKRAQNVLGARGFFHLLGAETAPRIEKKAGWSGILQHNLSTVQQRKLVGVTAYIEGLRHDSTSIDLLRVVQNISQTKQKKERKLRGVSLFETLGRNWSNYSDSTETMAGNFYYRWRTRRRIPSTWLADLMGYAWLSNEQGDQKLAEELGLRNDLTLAIYGDAPAFFAADIRSTGDRAALADAIGIEAEPKASQIVELISRMRDGGEAPDVELLRFRYAALARLCPENSREMGTQFNVGDLTNIQLRNRFGYGKREAGLIYADGTWVSPKSAYVGTPIFHGRRACVPGGREFARLWKAIGIDSPTISACVDVLIEIAQEPHNNDIRTVLLEIYRYINTQLRNASPAELSRLKKIPLWCGTEWQKKRPVYLVGDTQLARQVELISRVWSPPGNPTEISSFIEATEITPVDTNKYSIAGLDVASVESDIHLQHNFEAALHLFRDYLGLNSEAAYHSISGTWDQLLSLKVLIVPNLEVQFSLPGLKKRRLAINSYFEKGKNTFLFRSEELINTKEDGCRIISEQFGKSQNKETIELAWHFCWYQALRGDETSGIELSAEQSDGEDPLNKFEKAAKKRKGKRSTYERKTKTDQTNTKSGGDSKSAPLRQLKPLADLQTSSVKILNADNDIGGHRKKRTGSLRGGPAGAPKATGAVGSQNSGRKSYDNKQLEDHALRCLHHVLTTADLGELTDLRRFRNVGADSILDLKDFFEIKASAGDLPSTEQLTRSEFERAKRERKKFFLAVITGLEVGFETVVRIYNDPVRTLEWSPSTGVVFSGFKKKKHLAISINETEI
jgi:hypothetical protein